MGIIIAKFRKKKTTNDILEQLEGDIHVIEEFNRNTASSQKRTIGRFIFISICVYCIMAIIFYFKVVPTVIFVFPLVILPILLIAINRIITWYYNRKLRKNCSKLTKLKEEKNKILEEVMEKETYKVAKGILEKFAPEQIKKIPSPSETPQLEKSETTGSKALVVQGLRYRGSSTPAFPARGVPIPLGPKVLPAPSRVSVGGLSNTPSSISQQKVLDSPLRLPRSILPKDRSVLDKLVDYLIGDGPSNRYALICRNCSSHNGMALKEEFIYLSFKCCFCMAFNPAHKKRPVAPKLEDSSRSRLEDVKSAIFDSDSDSDSDDNHEPIITEPTDQDIECRDLNETSEKPNFEFLDPEKESTAMDSESDDVEVSGQKNLQNTTEKTE